MNRKEVMENEIKKLEKVSIENNLNYGIIFWISPIGGNLEHRCILSPSYNEVADWIDNTVKFYTSVECSTYVNGRLR